MKEAPCFFNQVSNLQYTVQYALLFRIRIIGHSKLNIDFILFPLRLFNHKVSYQYRFYNTLWSFSLIQDVLTFIKIPILLFSALIQSLKCRTKVCKKTIENFTPNLFLTINSALSLKYHKMEIKLPLIFILIIYD